MAAIRLLLVLCATIFFGEVAVMHLLEHWMIRDKTIESIVDSTLLLAIVFPVLYFSVLRSLVVTKARLEAGIRGRTADIEQAKSALESTIGQLETRQAEMILLGEMGSFFQSSCDIDEAMVVAEVKLAKLFPDMSGALFLMNSSRNILERYAVWGAASDGVDHFAPGDCWALRRSKPHVVTKAEQPLACRHAFHKDAEWQICLPLVAQGEALGTLCMSSSHAHGQEASDEFAVDSERMEFLVAASENLALAIANLRLQEKLSYQALRDPLTGLFNRRYLLETLDLELDRAASLHQSLSIAMFDVDHFKKFNDCHGHAAGDVVLSRLGALLLGWAKGMDIPVRFGGEEFTVVMPDTPADEAFVRIEDLRRSIEMLAIEHEGGMLGRVTISAGIASSPLHGTDRKKLIASADRALYQSKKCGRNRVTLFSDVVDQVAADDREAPSSRVA